MAYQLAKKLEPLLIGNHDVACFLVDVLKEVSNFWLITGSCDAAITGSCDAITEIVRYTS